MALSGLKLGFCVSLLAHGAAFSVVCALRHASASGPPAFELDGMPAIEIIVCQDEGTAQVSESAPAVAAPPEQVIATVDPTPAPPVSEISQPLPEPTEESALTLPAELNLPDKQSVPAEPVIEPSAEPSAIPRAQSTAAINYVNRTPAEYQLNPKPAYPEMARRRKEEGLVILKISLTREGRPETVEISRSSGFLLLDEAAQRALKRWRFHPARLDGRAVPSRVEVPVRFQLSN